MVGSSVVAIVGAGRLGGALMSGLLRAGRTPSEVVAAERDPGRAAEITRRYGVEVVDPAAAAAKAGVVVLATKPQDMGTVLAQLAPHVAPGTLVVSVAAGVTSAFVAERLAPGTPVVRVMTNTPLLVGEAMSAVCAGPGAGDEHVAAVEEMLRPVGRVVRVTETQLDAVTALSGSGPAYFFYLIEAMIEGGVLLGLPRALAAELVVQTAAGSARMLRDPGAGDPGDSGDSGDSDGAGGAAGEHPSLLREAVTSPGGTTVAALRQLDRGGVRAAVLDAVEAAWARSRELGAS
ncbi:MULTISPECIES: pyrroline-5-carboxylate reductase [unclassified Parafrankia]|uniref:pyrroline-5-carboxylate reductase n=1 Tax=unclassified Parafrankia TaxID=2994368 RepID=UPI000DA52D91|nr:MULTISPECIES: pyrroline-5-carboxylate reductase [unclassified Parafrankia]TCJ37902.1 pyrroline-5-carboxylate reductase [Parafrankia sp. BMG5.11]SQD93603.1 Pyrroline-5-carboxylate reductase [Parafrankia sp. Ea1.12]